MNISMQASNYQEKARAMNVSLDALLTKEATGRLWRLFKARNHKPSTLMWQGLERLQNRLTAMMSGKAESAYNLSSLDPGVGKTSAICTWLAAYIEMLSLFPDEEGVIIGLDRLEEIETLVQDADIPIDRYAVLVSNESDGGPKLNALGLGRDRANEALVLFTTKKQIQLRCKTGSFNEQECFHYNGKSRKVRIWDEGLILGAPLTLPGVELLKIVGVLRGNKFEELSKQIRKLSDELDTIVNDGQILLMPELGISLEEFIWLFRNAPKQEKEIAEVFAAMAGRVVTVRIDNQLGGVLVDCKESIPKDFAPCLITDASGRVRETYKIQHRYRNNLVFLQQDSSVKRYDKLTIAHWERGSGKSYYKANGTDWTAHEICGAIMSRPGEEFLIIHHKSLGLDSAIKAKLNKDEQHRVHFLTLGKHTATNKYSDVPNVVMAGMLNYRKAEYEALARASAIWKTSDGNLMDSELSRMLEAEAAHNILQATCRGRVRKAEGDQCPEARLWLIAPASSGVKELLPDIFPGCSVTRWQVKGKALSGKRKQALDYILSSLEDGNTRILGTDVRKLLKMTPGNFKNHIILNTDFLQALRENNIEQYQEKNRWWYQLTFEPVPGGYVHSEKPANIAANAA